MSAADETDWPFQDPPTPTTPVTTTRDVFQGDVVRFAVHGADGAWQLHGEPTLGIPDVTRSTLGETLWLDPTLAALASVRPSCQATRRWHGHPWQIDRLSAN
jgi:hypothetical protein